MNFKQRFALVMNMLKGTDYESHLKNLFHNEERYTDYFDGKRLIIFSFRRYLLFLPVLFFLSLLLAFMMSFDIIMFILSFLFIFSFIFILSLFSLGLSLLIRSSLKVTNYTLDLLDTAFLMETRQTNDTPNDKIVVMYNNIDTIVSLKDEIWRSIVDRSRIYQFFNLFPKPDPRYYLTLNFERDNIIHIKLKKPIKVLKTVPRIIFHSTEEYEIKEVIFDVGREDKDEIIQRIRVRCSTNPAGPSP